MGESPLLNGISKGVDNMVLPQNVLKGLGAVFTGENLIAHWRRSIDGAGGKKQRPIVRNCLGKASFYRRRVMGKLFLPS